MWTRKTLPRKRRVPASTPQYISSLCAENFALYGAVFTHVILQSPSGEAKTGSHLTSVRTT